MTLGETLLEALKVVASIAIPYIAVLKTRAELDRFAASQRAKQNETSPESELRRRWYHPLFKEQHAKNHNQKPRKPQ